MGGGLSIRLAPHSPRATRYGTVPGVRWMALGLVALVGCGGAAPPAPRMGATPGPAPVAAPRDAATRRALFAQAQAELGRGDAAAARRHFAALQPVYPELDDYVLAGLAQAAAQSGDAAGAEAAWSALIVQAPRSLLVPRAQLERGRLLAARGDGAAAAALAAARAGGDDEVRLAAALALGELALRAGDSAGAAAQLDAARRLQPGSPPAREAKRRLEALRARDPSLRPRGAGLQSELRLLLRERDYPAARQAADALLAVAPSPGVLRARADAEVGDGDVDAAVATLRLIVQHYPRTPEAADAQLRSATVLWNRDRNAEAAARFSAYLERWPGGAGAPEALYALARIAQGDGRSDAAMAGYRRLIAAAPASRQAREARWRIGWITYQEGRWQDAAGAFSAAAQGGGPADAPDAWYWRARSLERAGDRDGAVRGYRALLDAAPGSYYAYWAEQRVEGRPAAPGTVAAPTPVAIGAPPPGADAYHWQKARELTAAGVLGPARREMEAVERASGSAPDVAAALPRAYQAAGGYRDAIRLASARGEATAAILYPLAFWPQVSRAAEAERIDPLVPIALMRQESLFDPGARSPADARGLMQLLPSTAERVANSRGLPAPADRLYDPDVNITLGVAHLADLLRSYDGDPLRAFAAYNGGEEAVARWQQRFGTLPPDEFVESITYRETRDYVKKVIGNYRRYQQLYGR